MATIIFRTKNAPSLAADIVGGHETPHVHQFLARVMINDGSYIEDCACGLRQHVRRDKRGQVLEVFDDAVVLGGSSLDNSIFFRVVDKNLTAVSGNFEDRWTYVPEHNFLNKEN